MENYRMFGNKNPYNFSLFEEGDINDPVQDESAHITANIIEQQRKALIPLKEDLADWLSKLTGKTMNEKNLFEVLQTGAVLCELAHIICDSKEKAPKHKNRPKSAHVTAANHHGGRPVSVQSISWKEHVEPLPPPPKYKPFAQPSSFLARDNAANFISWCRQIGVDEACMFESECLVLQKQPRNVVLCLLDVGRIASRHGVVAPELVQLEEEIEQEERKYGLLNEAQSNGVASNNSHQPPLSNNLKARAKVLKLDDAVHRIVDGPPFDGQVEIERVGEGRYRIEGKLIFVRMLRGRHVMVRVGGGWDTLEHYLIKHDPTHFIPKITAKEICDTLSQDIASSRRQSAHSGSRARPSSRAALELIRSNKGYFVPLARRPHSAMN